MDYLFSKSDALLRRTSTAFKRYLFDKIRWENRLIGIKGARGTGKTTLLLQYLKGLDLSAGKALYLSLDDIYFSTNLLSTVIEEFYRQGGQCIVLDEVHKYPGWAREIKNLHDFYPELQMIFTGSSIIDLAKEEGDLSRRALMYELQGLSYREYLIMNKVLDIPSMKLVDILGPEGRRIAEYFPLEFRPQEHFRAYLSNGYYPFFINDREGYLQRLAQLVRAVIEFDMTEIRGFDPHNARKLLQLLFIISNNAPFKPNLTQLAQKSNIHRNTVLNYLVYLENARLIRLLQHEGAGLSLLQKPEKIYFNNTNLAFALSVEAPNTGTLRETFFLSQLTVQHHVTIPNQGDLLVDDRLVFEIGGRTKTHDQIADIPDSYIVKDQIDFPVGKSIPLWLFGFLY